MPAANKILITTESREFVILHRGRSETRPCEGCGGAMSTFVGIDEAVAMSGKRAMELLASALRGGVHLSESDEGLLLACCTSLAALKEIEEWSYEEIDRS